MTFGTAIQSTGQRYPRTITFLLSCFANPTQLLSAPDERGWSRAFVGAKVIKDDSDEQADGKWKKGGQ